MVERIRESSDDNNDVLNFSSNVNADIWSVLDYNNLQSEDLNDLLPQKILDLVDNKQNISLEASFDREKKEGRIRIVENNFSEMLSNKDDYDKWQQDISQAKEKRKQEGIPIVIMPQAPSSINRLHVKFFKDINEGKLKLNDRILLRCIFSIPVWSEKSLCIHDYDWEIWLWIWKDFYLDTLPKFAKKYSFRFIVGDQHLWNINFFTGVIWRYQIEDLKPEYRHTLFWSVFPEELFTFQFLYPEDIEKYILPNRIKT